MKNKWCDMTKEDNDLLLKCFKEFILDEIWFFNQLSNDNEMRKKAQNIFGKDLKQAMKQLKKQYVDFAYIEEMKILYRNNFKQVIKATGVNVNNELHTFNFDKMESE